VIREIGRLETDLPEKMWHLAQQIHRLSGGLLHLTPESVERYNSVVGEAATPFRCGNFASPSKSISILSDKNFCIKSCYHQYGHSRQGFV